MRQYNSNRKEKQSNSQSRGGETTNGDPKFAYIEPVQAQYLEVEVDNFEKSLRYFRNMVQKERILSTFKERSHYEKPSDKKRRKKGEAIRNLLKLENKSEFSLETDRPRRPKFKDVGENDV